MIDLPYFMRICSTLTPYWSIALAVKVAEAPTEACTSFARFGGEFIPIALRMLCVLYLIYCNLLRRSNLIMNNKIII